MACNSQYPSLYCIRHFVLANTVLIQFVKVLNGLFVCLFRTLIRRCANSSTTASLNGHGRHHPQAAMTCDMYFTVTQAADIRHPLFFTVIMQPVLHMLHVSIVVHYSPELQTRPAEYNCTKGHIVWSSYLIYRKADPRQVYFLPREKMVG